MSSIIVTCSELESVNLLNESTGDLTLYARRRRKRAQMAMLSCALWLRPLLSNEHSSGTIEHLSHKFESAYSSYEDHRSRTLVSGFILVRIPAIPSSASKL